MVWISNVHICSSQLHFQNKCQVIYIHNLPSSVSQSMLRKRFEAFGHPEDCKVVIKNEWVQFPSSLLTSWLSALRTENWCVCMFVCRERFGVITLRSSQNGQTPRHRWDSLGPCGGNGSRRFGRKRYIDLGKRTQSFDVASASDVWRSGLSYRTSEKGVVLFPS